MTEENPKKTFTEDEVREKIKKHSKLLEDVSAEGVRIQDRQRALTNELQKIVDQSRQLVGAIKTLQDLLGEEKSKTDS